MEKNNSEVYLVQNPAIGAAILWRFACGYYDADHAARRIPFPLLFLVLPILLREDLRKLISSTNKTSGLQKIYEKLYHNKQADYFCCLQESAKQYRPLTLESFHIASDKGLLCLSYTDALVTPVIMKNSGIPRTCAEFLNLAEKLGLWCSSLTLYEISALLKVRF